MVGLIENRYAFGICKLAGQQSLCDRYALQAKVPTKLPKLPSNCSRKSAAEIGSASAVFRI